MRSSQLTAKQLARMQRQIRKMEHYLNCLCGRMHQTHFPHDDPIKLAGEKAHAAMAELSAAVKSVTPSE